MQTDWYRDFFSGVALDFWRQAVTPEQTESEVAFLEQTLVRAPEAAELLDVPCGNGRHALALAARGHRVTGVDLAEEFVREAETRSRSAGLAADFVLGDMRELPWQGRFDGAYCLGNSFGYLDHGGTLTFLAALSRALKPSARFVLETGAVAESLLPALQERRWWRVADIHMLVANRYDAAESRLDTEYTFVRGGVVDVRVSRQHVYTAAEIGRLLEQVGLGVHALYASPDRAPFRLGAPRLLAVAEKAP